VVELDEDEDEDEDEELDEEWDEDEELDEEWDEDEELELEDEDDTAVAPCITETVLAPELATYTSPVAGFKSMAMGPVPTLTFTICWPLGWSTVTLLSV
jgi:hypothetical protein